MVVYRHYDKKALREYKKILSLIDSESVEVVKTLYKLLIIKRISYSRIYRYMQSLKKMIKIINKPIRKWSEEDIIEFLYYVKDESIYTIKEYEKLFKKLKSIVKYNYDFPVIDNKTEKHIITYDLEDVKFILKNVKEKYKLFFAMLWDTGARPHELLNLTYKDIITNKEGIWIRLNGKTGERTIKLLEINKLILKGKPNEYVFKFSYDTVNKYFQRFLKRHNLKGNLYAFRHTRATYLALYMNEFALKKHFGWSMDSKMVKIYVHLSKKQFEDKIYENIRPSGILP